MTSRAFGRERLHSVLRAIIDRGVARYIARYGDKTQVVDPATGATKVERHYDLIRQNTDGYTITIHGATGHMGSLPQNDAAIAKWAYVMHELIEARRGRTCLHCGLAGRRPVRPSRLIFEGAQGFLPTHTLEAVKGRVRIAFLGAIQRYLADEGLPPEAITCNVSFDKLHNDAYAGDPDRKPCCGPSKPPWIWAWRSLMNRCAAGRCRVTLDCSPGNIPTCRCSPSARAIWSTRIPSVSGSPIADLFESIGFAALFLLRETGRYARVTAVAHLAAPAQKR